MFVISACYIIILELKVVWKLICKFRSYLLLYMLFGRIVNNIKNRLDGILRKLSVVLV